MSKFLTLVGGLVLFASTTGAMAGGFNLSPADTDILFEPGKVVARSSVIYVNPQRKLKDDQMPGLRGTEYSKPYYIPSAAVKFNITDDLRCAGTYGRPYGANSAYDTMNNRGKLTEKFHVDEYAATCAYFMPVGPGNVFLLGGVFVEELQYDFTGYTRSPFGGFTPLNFDLSSHDVGYRLGVGYEIPEKGVRAQLLYRSGTDHDANGTAHLTQLGAEFPSTGQGELPQSVEMRVQSGIAPGWLAFGSVKWTDWSTFQRLNVQLRGQPFGNDYFWQDGWTISGGVAHAFDENWTGLASVTWDRGVSTGFDMTGTLVGMSVGVSHKDTWGGELRLTGSLFHNFAVAETAYLPGTNSSASASNGYALGINYKLSF